MIEAIRKRLRNLLVRRVPLRYENDCTIINELHFQLSLPGRWHDHSTKDSYDLRCEDRHQQVTIAISLTRRRLTGEELLKTILTFYDARIKAIRTLSGDTCHFSEKWIDEPLGGLNIHRIAHVESQRVQVSINIFGRTDKIIVVTYYFYFDDAPMDNFENFSRQIMSLFALT